MSGLIEAELRAKILITESLFQGVFPFNYIQFICPWSGYYTEESAKSTVWTKAHLVAQHLMAETFLESLDLSTQTLK